MWWDILKNAELGSESTGSTLDASKIKVNIQDDECKKKIRELIDSPLSEGYIEEGPFSEMPEEVACEFLKDLKVIDKDIMGLLPEALHEKYGDGRKAQLFMGYTIVWIINISSTHANKLIGYCEIKGKEVFAVGVETYMKFFPKEWRDEDLKTYKEWRKLL